LGLLSLEIEDLRTDYSGNMDALTVEDVSVHDLASTALAPPWTPDKLRQPPAQLSEGEGGLTVSRFRGFLKRKIRDWMAPRERFIF
jgi:hypothetical protein